VGGGRGGVLGVGLGGGGVGADFSDKKNMKFITFSCLVNESTLYLQNKLLCKEKQL
jgi:hypothetical protein